jgi:transposase
MQERMSLFGMTGAKRAWSQENLPTWRQGQFEALRPLDLLVCRAWAIKENLQHLGDYRDEGPMRRYFKRWCFWATHARLAPIKKAAQTLKAHWEAIGKIETVKRMACGFGNRSHYRTAIYFECGGLDLFPKPAARPTLCFKAPASQYVGRVPIKNPDEPQFYSFSALSLI